MPLTLTALGRRKARSVCIVTDLPVRLQAKSKRPVPELLESRFVQIGSTTALIGLTATGELTIWIEPP